ncbi:hypothetical protein ACFFTK_20725 [Pseudonocardia petroleophila]|uniref:Uncharacterized protein n=1 Tax=Pseudonocardia petroleophila TaxID=37331 RepID=A0A7G7MF05_9PSEU|nr:hypothetical protein [Pseudonocardia petroleophila]QNG51366.1 hypothetical protein H6H00_24990 [Pseudonocardia petroleophila]
MSGESSRAMLDVTGTPRSGSAATTAVAGAVDRAAVQRPTRLPAGPRAAVVGAS